MSLYEENKTHQIMNLACYIPTLCKRTTLRLFLTADPGFSCLSFFSSTSFWLQPRTINVYINIPTGHIKQNRNGCAPHFLSCSAMGKKFSFEQQASYFTSRSSPLHSLRRLSRFHPTSYINCTLSRALQAKGKQHIFFLDDSWWV